MKLKESINLPKEGFFWVIDEKVIGYSEEVPKYNHELKQSITHEELWEKIKSNYDNLEFDYYPRGRIMVDPEYNLNNEFEGFSCMIFIDPCLNNRVDKDRILEYYNLNIPTVTHVMWMGNLKERAGINHYSCHNCRNRNE